MNGKPGPPAASLFPKKPLHPTKPQFPVKHLSLPASLTVNQLAEISGLKQFQIIARLMELGVFPNVNFVMDYATAEKALSVYNMTTELQKE